MISFSEYIKCLNERFTLFSDCANHVIYSSYSIYDKTIEEFIVYSDDENRIESIEVLNEEGNVLENINFELSPDKVREKKLNEFENIISYKQFKRFYDEYNRH